MAQNRLGMLIVILIPTLVVADDSKWKEYKSKEGKFTVLMPGTPMEQTQEAKTPAGAVKVHMALVIAGDDVYLIGHNTIPGGTKTYDVEKGLDGARTNASKQFGKVDSEKKLTLGKAKHPGREVLFIKGDTGARVRYYVFNDALYQIVVAGKVDVIKGDDATKFLDSFKAEE